MLTLPSHNYEPTRSVGHLRLGARPLSRRSEPVPEIKQEFVDRHGSDETDSEWSISASMGSRRKWAGGHDRHSVKDRAAERGSGQAGIHGDDRWDDRPRTRPSRERIPADTGTLGGCVLRSHDDRSTGSLFHGFPEASHPLGRRLFGDPFRRDVVESLGGVSRRSFRGGATQVARAGACDAQGDAGDNESDEDGAEDDTERANRRRRAITRWFDTHPLPSERIKQIKRDECERQDQRDEQNVNSENRNGTERGENAGSGD